jgi:hypothetical protein
MIAISTRTIPLHNLHSAHYDDGVNTVSAALPPSQAYQPFQDTATATIMTTTTTTASTSTFHLPPSNRPRTNYPRRLFRSAFWIVITIDQQSSGAKEWTLVDWLDCNGCE